MTTLKTRYWPRLDQVTLHFFNDKTQDITSVEQMAVTEVLNIMVELQSILLGLILLVKLQRHFYPQ